MPDRYVRDLEGPPAKKSRLQPLITGTRVLIQSQTGKVPFHWDKTGVVVEILRSDQYIVKINGSNRLTRRDRRSLRAYIPAFEDEESRFRRSLGRDTDRRSDSVWGARGHMVQSADSNSDLVGDLIDMGTSTGTQDLTSTSSTDGKGNFEVRQPGISNPSQNAGLRRSSRVNKGKIPRV